MLWKIRVMLPSGDLGEVEFNGSLAEIAANDFDGPIMVVQRVVPPEVMRAASAKAAAAGGQADEAKGGDAVSVKKS